MILKPGEELPKVQNVVTSFNEAGYKRYGKEFIRTFLEHWPKSVRLTVYYEGDEFDFDEGLSWRPIEEVEHYKDFMESLRFPIMHGIVGEKYDINFDARMCRKVLIQCHALKKYGGKVFWLDADSITHTDVPVSFLDEMLPDEYFNCYLGRDGWYYTESGFIGFNADHPIAGSFMNAYVSIPLTGVIFTQQGWHDCYAFDAIRHMCKKPEAFKNLAEWLPKGTMHPFVNSRVGDFIDHKKGLRKESRSTQADLVVKKEGAYWNDAQ